MTSGLTEHRLASALPGSQDKGVFGEPIGMKKTRTRGRMFSWKPRLKASASDCWWVGRCAVEWGEGQGFASQPQCSRAVREEERLVGGCSKFASPGPCRL